MNGLLSYHVQWLGMKHSFLAAFVTMAIALFAVIFDVPMPSGVFVEDEAASDGTVVRVVDGDTLVVMENGEEVTVRIIGINTPETVDPRRPVECFGEEASRAAKAMLTGEGVTLISDSTQGAVDKYGRALRYVALMDGTDVGLALISSGYAYEYTYDVPYARQSVYQAAEDVARTGGVGLWGEGGCEEGARE